MARTAYERIAQRWLPTPVTDHSNVLQDSATAKWPLLAALALPAFAGLATAWFLREREPGVTTVKDLMVSDVVTIGPESTLAEAARRMRDHNVGILPVVVNGQVAGVITDRGPRAR